MRITRSNRAGRGFPIASLLLALAPAALAWRAYRHDLAEAMARVASGQIVETAGGPIEYAERGDGPALLVIHGAGGGFDQGLEFSEAFVRAGFRVIAPSRFGYLRTPLPADASPETQADAHACLLDALGIDTVAVIGASAGAPSAVQLALRHPGRVSALVLMVPALWNPGIDRSQLRRPSRATELLSRTALRSDVLFWIAIRNARKLLTRAILATPNRTVQSASLSEQRRVRKVLEHILPISARQRGLSNDATVVAGLQSYPLESITVPTLLVGCRDDLFGTWASIEHAATSIPGARVLGYERGGHLFVGHGHAIETAIATFLREPWEAA